MIGPGWLPGARLRPSARKRTLPYTRTRRRARPRMNKQAPIAQVPNTDHVLFDHGPAELPVATTVPRAARARVVALVADLQHWVAARWQWLRPRTVPCAVAGLGMVAVLASADYLAHSHGKNAAPPSAKVVHINVAR
jgi:hypothetical protein